MISDGGGGLKVKPLTSTSLGHRQNPISEQHQNQSEVTDTSSNGTTMSGGPLEIAGLLLGGLPLLILALDTRTALRRWRRPELRALARGLRTEQARLQNVLEKLLRGIVPDALIAPMVADPFGCALWAAPAVVDKVRRRLGGRDYELFGECVRGVGEVVGELRGLLGEGGMGVGRVRWVVRRGECLELMERLREGVGGLEGLVVGNMELERGRRCLRRRASRFLGGEGVGWLRSLRGPKADAAAKAAAAAPYPSRGLKGTVMLHDVLRAEGIQIVLSSSAEATGWGSSLALWKVMALTAVISTRCRVSGRRAARRFTLPPPGEDDLVATSGSTGNSTLMAVGVLLIEIALGRSVDREGAWCRGLLTAGAADADEGRRGSLVERVNTLSSSGYYGVVRRCVGQGMARDESGEQSTKDVVVEIIVS